MKNIALDTGILSRIERMPLVAITVAFILGMVTSRILKPSYTLVCVLILLYIPLLLPVSARRPSRVFWFIPVFFFAGALSILPVLKPSFPDNHISRLIKEDRSIPLKMEGYIATYPETRAERMRFVVDVRKVFVDEVWRDVEGRILVTLDGREKIRRGDLVRFVAFVRKPYNFGNPGGFDYTWYLSRRGIDLTGRIKDERFIVRTGYREEGLAGYIDDLRERIGVFIDTAHLTNRELLRALLIGDRWGVLRETKEIFIRSGTAHLLAISGLHVGMVAFLFYRVFLSILKRSETLALALDLRKVCTVLTVLPVLSYGAIAGFSIPTQRAVVMVLAFMLTFLMDRARDLYTTLALAGLLILLLSPQSLWEVSFQLSFVAVLTILYFVPYLEGFWEGDKDDHTGRGDVMATLYRGARRLFVVSIVATLGTYPVVAYNFNRVSLVAPVANLFVVPVVGFMVVPLGLLSVAILPLWHGGAELLLKVSDGFLWLGGELAELFAHIPYSSVWVGRPTLLEVGLYYLLFMCLVNIRRHILFRYGFTCSVIFMLLNMAYIHYRPLYDNNLRVTFISVGHGDSILVELPGGKTMLIDGGGFYSDEFDVGERVVAPFLWHRRIRHIDYMVLTHSQIDHRGGLRFIAENFDVGEFWWNGYGDMGELGDVLAERGTRIVTVNSRRNELTVNGVRFTFLHPDQPGDYDINDGSIVFKLSYGSRAFLFTGDISFRVEEVLVGSDIRSDVLKVPHHGSRYSSSSAFIEEVGPLFAVFSSGRGGMFDLPHTETIERYRRLGVKILRTDRDGAVTFTTDGEGLCLRTYLTVKEWCDKI